MAVEKTFALECGDVLHHRGLTSESKVALNLARARRDSPFALFALNEIKDAFLAIG
jgi:hypothetical protein